MATLQTRQASTHSASNTHPASTLVELLQRRATTHQHQVLYTFLQNGIVETGHLTYAMLEKRARAIAAYLQTQSIAPGQRVLLSYPLTEGLSFIEAFFGCLYAGAVAVTAWPPLNQSLLSELQYKATDAEVSLGLTSPTLLTQIKKAFSQKSDLSYLPWRATETLSIELSDSWKAPDLEPQTLAYLQYTSGSTGIPKGAMISHQNLLHNSAVIAHCFGTTPADRGVMWLPLYHDMGLIGGVLQPLYVGFPVHLMSPLSFMRQPLRWLQAISHTQATVSGGPNFAYDLCIRKLKSAQKSDDLKDLNLSKWAVAFNGAEAVQARTLHEFYDAFAPYQFRPEAFCPCYGMAETTVMATSKLRPQSPQVVHLELEALGQNRVLPMETESIEKKEAKYRAVVSCGQTVLGQQIRIVEPDTGILCPADKIGEIWFAGDSVAQGYWNASEAATGAFQGIVISTSEGPFLRTGDLGFVSDGQLYITGRLKEIIILQGRNLYPQHLEQAVGQSHPAFAMGQGAAFSLDEDGEEQLVIVQEISPRSLQEVSPIELITVIQTVIAQQFLVELQKVLLIKSGSIPKTPTGKIQRARCCQQLQNGDLSVIQAWQNNTGEGLIDWATV